MKEKPVQLAPLIPHVADLRVGAMLRKQRQVLKITLADVEIATKIRGKYLVSLEACDYGSLPDDIYTKGFVQSYADFLGLEGRLVAKQYQSERGSVKTKRAVAAKKPVQRKARGFYITPRLFIVAGSVLVAAGIIAYLSWQFQGLSAPPRLAVDSPGDNQVIDGGLTTISGSVAGGSNVFVNDSPVLLDARGHFSDQLALQDGVNTVRVTATNRLGREAIVTRNVLARVAKMANGTADSPQLIPGVRVIVTAKGGTASITIAIDGQGKPRVTMLDGTSQTFEGTDRITISTTNAGVTNLTVTNSVAAGKTISPVGHDGEAKNDLEFTKDTVIP